MPPETADRRQYVVDASVILPFFLHGEHTSNAKTLVQRLRTHELWMPGFGLVQVANALWSAAQAGEIDERQAEMLAREWLTLPISFMPVREVALRAFTIAVNQRTDMYAAHTIALAERLGCPLVTLDETQARAAEAVGVTVKPLADFPPPGVPDTGSRL